MSNIQLNEQLSREAPALSQVHGSMKSSVGYSNANKYDDPDDVPSENVL